jgi:uncharacterized membrane protein
MANQVETIIELQYENRDRKSAFLRLFFALPVGILLALFTQAAHWGFSSVAIVLPVVLTLVFRQIYPSWVLTFNHAVNEFSVRVAAYALLLTDKYPTIEANSSTAVIFPDVEGGKKLKRYAPIYKWILAIPLYVIGFVYSLYSLVALLLAWLQISLTGKAPAWALDIIYSTVKFWNRVAGYAILLVTDEYPSFSLN